MADALAWLENNYVIEHLLTTSTITTVANTAEYNLAADFNGFLKSMDIDGYSSEITFLSPAEMESKFINNADTGQPRYATLAPPNATDNDTAPGVKKIRLAPVPAAAYTINYTYQKKHPAYAGLGTGDYLRLEDAEADALCWKALINWRSDITGVQFQMWNESLKMQTGQMQSRRVKPQRSQIGDIFSNEF